MAEPLQDNSILQESDIYSISGPGFRPHPQVLQKQEILSKHGELSITKKDLIVLLATKLLSNMHHH